MAKVALLVLIALYCGGDVYARSVSVRAGVDGWYWRDVITGKHVAECAIPGGKDHNGKTTFIGQVPHFAGNTILPGSYDPTANQVYYEFGRKQWTTKENIKVLCTQEPEHFKWVSASKGDAIKSDDNWILVHGGSEDSKPFAVGRVKRGDQVVIGKVPVINDNSVYELIHYNYDDAGTTSNEFEVLYYVKKLEGCDKDNLVITIN